MPQVFEVLLYYKFVHLENPQGFREAHFAKCLELGLKGRVLIAREGINGTLAGPVEQTKAYKKFLHSLPGFAETQFKCEKVDSIPFEKLKVKLRPSVLNMGLKPEEDVDPSRLTAHHVSPVEWKRILDTEKDFVLLDVRNNYESRVGHFRGAICPDLEGFSDFPRWVEELEVHKDKKILMYCTGGIRCEKFSSLLLQRGFKDLHQLEGGILNYAREIGGEHFEGRCFVFDDRLVVDVKTKPDVIASCHYCGSREDRYVNCANMECNQLFIVCDACAEKQGAACSEACRQAPWRRPFDPKSFRIPFRSKGKVFTHLAGHKFHQQNQLGDS